MKADSDRLAPSADHRPASLHARVLKDIEGHILTGVWPPGHRIPSEHELGQGYGCSRMTVSKALTELVRTGLIERRRKAGSFVRLPQSQSAVLEIKDIAAEVSALGLAYTYEITARHRRRASAVDRARLGIAERDPIVALSCRHFAGGRPFCLVAVPDAAAEAFGDVAPGPWLVGRVPWTAAEHRIRAHEADAAIASGLALACGTACLVIERRTFATDRPVTAVRLTYPGAAHELVARFGP